MSQQKRVFAHQNSLRYSEILWWENAKEKYRGIFEIQKSGDKTSLEEIGLDIRTHASPKVGQDQVSGGVSVLCWHAAPVAYVSKSEVKTAISVYRSTRKTQSFYFHFA